MKKRTSTIKPEEGRGIFAALFPRQHDFHAMLEAQADRTVAGVRFVRGLAGDRTARKSRAS